MKVFITGASGYIGGTVGQRLLAAGHTVAGLARSEARAKELAARGILPVRGSLADLDVLAEAARTADAVVNAADSDDPHAVGALIGALEGTGKRFIHTSGSSIVADKANGDRVGQVFTEDSRPEPVTERTARVAVDRAVLQAAHTGVHSVVICPSLIYGSGSGIHQDSIQVPNLIAAAAERRAGVHVGAGMNVWANVHIKDVASLFELALERAPAGSFFFAENGELSMRDLAAAISRMLGFGGITVGLTPMEAVRLWGPGPALISLGSNSRVSAAKARAMLGWRPEGASLVEEVEGGCYRRGIRAG